VQKKLGWLTKIEMEAILRCMHEKFGHTQKRARSVAEKPAKKPRRAKGPALPIPDTSVPVPLPTMPSETARNDDAEYEEDDPFELLDESDSEDHSQD
jgi:hypothetical protein